MGDPNANLEAFVRKTLRDHVRHPETIQLKVRQSKEGKYQSITAIFEAHSKDQLNLLYQLFKAHPGVQMVL